MAKEIPEFGTPVSDVPEFGTPQVDAPEFGTPAEDETSLARTATGLGAEVLIGESGRLGSAAAGAAIGSFFGPVGTAIGGGLGYVTGGLAFGAAGSVTRQRIQNPDEDIDKGELVADSLINLIPGSKAAKGAGFFARAGSAAMRQGAVGAGIGIGAETIETGISEKRLPTLQELGERGISTAALAAGLGVSGEAVSKAYSKFAGLPSRKLTEAFKAGDPDAKIIVDGVEMRAQEYRQQFDAQVDERFKNIQEKYSDENVRAAALQDFTIEGKKVNPEAPLKVGNDEQNYYVKRRLAEAKIQAKNQKIAEVNQLDNDQIVEFATRVNREPGEVSAMVDNYLHAKHAKAYNKKHGDGAAQYTTKEAQDVIRNFEKSGLDKELRGSLELRRGQSRQILDTLVNGGLVSQKLATELRQQFPDYVPLNRIMDDESLDNALRQKTASGFVRHESKSSGLREAKGSKREVLPIKENIYSNLVEATRRAEVNKANIAFKKLIESNKGNDIAVVRKPKVVKTPLGGADFETPGNHVLTVYDKGERYFVEFADPKIARAMKGMGKNELSGLLKIAQKYNRFVGGLYTRFNPEFLIPNLFRDRSEAFVNNASKMDFSQAVKTLLPARVTSDMNVIRKNLMGLDPSNPKEAELFSLYKEFKDAGGSSGGLGLTTVRDVEKNIQELASKIDSPVKRKVRRINEIVSGVNEIVEDATRFGTFRQAIAAGLSRDQAALAARNSSFDPLLGGTETDTLRALYLFSNPAIQGAKNFLRSMRKPKIAMGVMGGLTALTMSLDKWNQMQDPDWRAKLKANNGSNWKTNKNLIIVTGKNEDGSLSYVSIPIGYSMVPFKIIADTAQRMATGQDVGDPGELAIEVGQEIIDSYNPMGGSPVPTILRPRIELATNKDGLGRDIRPSWLEQKTMSATEKIYPWTATTQGGEMAMALTDTLKDMGYETSPENLLYLYQTWFGGPGKTVERLFNVSAKLSNGKELQKNEIPIARRFFGDTYSEAWEQRNGEMQTIKQLEKQEGTKSAVTSRQATNIVREVVKGETPEERQAILRAEMAGVEPSEALNRKIEAKLLEKALGITYTDKARKQLGVANGARAQSYVETIQKIPVEQVGDYLRNEIEKGILTDKVAEQIANSLAFRQYMENR